MKNIGRAMDLEADLAREESRELDNFVDGLPDDELKRQAQAQKSMLGDLANIPETHPLRIAIEEARVRFEEEEQAVREETARLEAEAKNQTMRKAKKLDEKKAATRKRIESEDRERRLRSASKLINNSMSDAMDSIKRLNDNILASQSDFAGNRYAQIKMERLSRVLVATMRGISELKINAGRVVENG